MLTTTVKQNGFEAILLPGDGRKDKVVIVMSGSNGGMALTRQCAEFYHQNGIPALALALFATEGTQPDLDRVPLEYVERAISWLQAQGYARIGIDGMSKGSEMALLAASRFDSISCVIARVPSYFISEGLSGRGKNKGPSGTAGWSYHGEGLPYAPYRIRKFNILSLLLKHREFRIISFNENKDVIPESIIPVEKIKAPILLLSSVNDAVWPSYQSACLIEDRLSEIAFPYPHKHIAFDHMSHVMVTDIPLIYRFAFKTERSRPKQCKADREALRKELLRWVSNVW